MAVQGFTLSQVVKRMFLLFLTHDDVKRTSYLVKGRKTVVTYATSHTQKQLITLARKCLGI